ncbi:MAG: cyanophycinase [Candidatus Sericytochromatia bacterium]|nr:cyanophycinase [Candidatus Sericytochromatia bacterium]
MSTEIGRLVIIGGAEDKEGDKQILARVIALSGADRARIAVITTASSITAEMEAIYTRAFLDLGAASIIPLHIDDRADANNPDHVEAISNATGVFMTGGSQARLAHILGGSEVAKAMHRSRRDRGTCIAGTSAGASAISEHMVRDGDQDILPRKDMTNLIPGLGLLKRVLIDQHFTQRQRLARLVAAVAENPFVLGIGIDENTALVVDADTTLEVIGAGTVNIVDGRSMDSNITSIRPGTLLTLNNINLHILAAGARFHVESRTVRPSVPQPVPVGSPFPG